MRLRNTAYITILASVLMAAFRTFVVACHMEKNIFENDTYYLSDAPFVRVFMVLVAVAVVAGVAYSFYINSKKGVLILERGAAPVGSLIAAFSIFGTTFAYVTTVITEGGSFEITSIVTLVLMVLTAVKFLLLGLRFDENVRCGVADALAAVLPILFSAGRLIEAFMSTNASPLASSGGYHIVSLCAVLMFFLYEGKACVSDLGGAMFTLFGCASIFFLLVYSVPNIILHCFGTFTFDTHAAFSIVDIGLSVYIAARLRTAYIKIGE